MIVLLTQYCAGDKIEKNEMGGKLGQYRFQVTPLSQDTCMEALLLVQCL